MDDDDDYFSDDFDSLPPGTLYQLEQSAYQATQAQRQHQSTTLKPPPPLHSGLTNEYGTLEVGELEAEVYDNVGAAPARPLGGAVTADAGGWATSGIMERTMEDPMELDDKSGEVLAYGELNARLKQLAQERDQMKRDLEDAKRQTETKAGEISIIRSKQAKMVQEYDRQLALLRNSMTEEAAKHKREVDAAMTEGKMLATENMFLQHDLVDETYQLRNHKAKHKAEEKGPPVTPKKSRVLPFRDGFDDEEIAMVSPSKSARSKRATPSVPGKRKRQASQDSPAPLQLISVDEPMIIDVPADAPEKVPEERKSAETGRYNQRLAKRLLNHRMLPGEETDIEAMAKMAFPAEPKRPMSSIFLDEMARLDTGNYVVEYAQSITKLWQHAIKERFYKPVPRFVAIARFILVIDETPLQELITALVGVLQDSVEVNAVPRFRYSPAAARERARTLRQTPQSDLQPLVDSTEALRLLFHIACEVLHVKAALEGFWREIRHTFILVMLHGSQPLRDIVLILNLLSTSIRPESFGPIMSDEEGQADVQKWIVDRLTFMLSESTQPDEGVDPYTPFDICAMRLEVLHLLETLAFNPAFPAQEHGSAIIAAHPNALARLFRSMHDELDALYSSPPEQDLRVALVNGLMRLIFGVMRRHGPFINMQEKLACVSGSKQKHLVVLTRLAFCDGSVLEAGIDDETVDMAHELLEEWANPQEAESLAEAFPSSRRE
ncbi:uncharacterized protein PFLUO_LOCUS4659 [Penicillium psychrofluorescens]|uniref:uncharacterized protein n=1 Tax=Penicillium psychrofluorescens TaxID=3158075 RepID=UPI003CCDCAF6